MSLLATVLVISSIRSASVLLPWSMCAMMAKFRTRSGGTSVSRSNVAGSVAAAARGTAVRRFVGAPGRSATAAVARQASAPIGALRRLMAAEMVGCRMTQLHRMPLLRPPATSRRFDSRR